METLFGILVLVAFFLADYIPKQLRKNKMDEMVRRAMDIHLLQTICSWQNGFNTEERFLVSYRDPFAIEIIKDFQAYISRKSIEQDISYDYCKNGEKDFISIYLEKYFETTKKYIISEKGILTDHGLAMYRLWHTIYLVSNPRSGLVYTLEENMIKRFEADMAPPPPKPKRTRKPKDSAE